MNRVSAIATIAVLSSILTPVVVSATGMIQKPAAPEPQARIETAAATSTPVRAEEEPTCTRKVKVVYAGYGEARAVACAVTGDTRR